MFWHVCSYSCYASVLALIFFMESCRCSSVFLDALQLLRVHRSNPRGGGSCALQFEVDMFAFDVHIGFVTA